MSTLVVGISGASGAIYGVRLLEVLADMADVTTHLVITRPAEDMAKGEFHGQGARRANPLGPEGHIGDQDGGHPRGFK